MCDRIWVFTRKSLSHPVSRADESARNTLSCTQLRDVVIHLAAILLSWALEEDGQVDLKVYSMLLSILSFDYKFGCQLNSFLLLRPLFYLLFKTQLCVSAHGLCDEACQFFVRLQLVHSWPHGCSTPIGELSLSSGYALLHRLCHESHLYILCVVRLL